MCELQVCHSLRILHNDMHANICEIPNHTLSTTHNGTWTTFGWFQLLEQLQLDIQISTPNMAIEESELSLDNTQETSLQEHAIVGDYMIATGDSTTNEGRIIVTKEVRWT